MMLCSQEKFANDKLAEFSRPVESIMRCEDFKSNFARRLSNRYIGRSPSLKQQQPSLKLRPADNKSEATTENVQSKIIPYCPIPAISNLGQNAEVPKTLDKAAAKQDEIKSAEVNALNMEVETLKWQLSQTEANRQMHLALLKQIVSFLNRVKEHMECQKIEKPKELSSRIMTGSFSTADLPRSRSVLHFNKHLEYSMSPVKKLTSRKMSKSITNVNGFEDSNAVWNQSKLFLNQEAESGQKITEEISRLIILANTVISTKIPDLSCSCVKTASDVNDYKQNKPDESIRSDDKTQSKNNSCLDLIEEDGPKLAALNGGGDGSNDFHGTTICNELDGRRLSNNSISPSIILSCSLEEDFENVKLNEKELCPNIPKNISGASKKSRIEKAKEFNHVSNFIEDESGFSSMSSFQEIGIPIINIIPPTPCKDVVFPEDLNILNDEEDWKTGPLEIDKQAVKVFWV